MARILKTFESSSSSATYDVKEGDDGIIWCTCPGWRFQKLPKEARACKHMKIMGYRGDSLSTGASPSSKALKEAVGRLKKAGAKLTGKEVAAEAAKATRERKAAEAKGRLKGLPFKFMLSHKFEADRMKHVNPAMNPAAGYVAEMKYDGAFTMMVDGELYSRRGHVITHRFPEVPRLFDVVLLGELAIVDDSTGVTDFERFLTRNTDDNLKIVNASRENPATFFVFDILALEGNTLTGLPFKARRKILEEYWSKAISGSHGNSIAPVEQENIELVQQIGIKSAEEVDTLVNRAFDLGIEGVMVKDLAAPYEGGKRTHHWMKAKKWLDIILPITTHGFTGVGDGYTVTVKLPNGNSQDVNCGSQEMRKQLEDGDSGGVCKFDADIKYQQESSTGKLRFPSIKRLVKK